MEALRKIKQESGKDILMYGSARLLASLLANNLVDQLDLMLCPVTLGAGQKLFEDKTQFEKFKPIAQTGLKSGMTILSYQPL